MSKLNPGTRPCERLVPTPKLRLALCEMSVEKGDAILATGGLVRCGAPVSGGGNMHAIGHCPPARGHNARRSAKAKREGVVSRGMPVAGTGKVNAGARA